MTTPPDPSRTDPADPLPSEVFSSWESALAESVLKPKQIEALQTMVDEGRAATLADAASILDLQETIIHPPEHMWGS